MLCSLEIVIISLNDFYSHEKTFFLSDNICAVMIICYWFYDVQNRDWVRSYTMAVKLRIQGRVYGDKLVSLYFFSTMLVKFEFSLYLFIRIFFSSLVSNSNLALSINRGLTANRSSMRCLKSNTRCTRMPERKTAHYYYILYILRYTV